jgi:NAD(P)-dependent dehydrogenase (short-subunit alcohol dehydrogenase family)
MSLLKDRVFVVTGAASGIGRASAVAIAAAGGKVAVSDVNTTGGEETAQMICDSGGEAFFMRVDVTRPEQVESFVKAAVDRFGGLDGAFNNAGVGGHLMKLHELDEAGWDTVINVNLKAVWLCMKYEITHLRKGRGAIVNMASAAGLLGMPYNAVYSASKHGVVGLTRAAALEYARSGIRVNAVCPGFVETPMVAHIDDERPGMVERFVGMNPMKRLGEPREVADAVVWLLSDAASFVNGHALSIDGGLVVG